MIQLFADGALVYDSRLDDLPLLTLTATTGLNKGGTLEFTMPPGHPRYGALTAYKTIVELYRDGVQEFRGRVLYTTDDFENRRKVTCEGELCFFLDAVSRPYLYQTTPADIFADIVATYNDQVETAKQFRVGTVTVTDANDYVRLESENAESCMDTIKKLLDRCGGYIVFTTAADGARAVNWYADLGYRSAQTITFGENLLSFSRSGANTNLATVILPYGAKEQETGLRVGIESVNGGLDYIQDDAAVALRGRITQAVTWDDVTEPANLLRKAQEYLAGSRYVVNSLELSAVDLHYLDKTIDAFQVGDLIRVISRPHAVDDDFLLTERTEDFLNPAAGKIVLGKDVGTLTDADVAGDKHSMNALHTVTHQITADYQTGIANAVQSTERTLASLIDQASTSILLQVADQYATNDQLTEAISTSLSVLRDQVLIEFDSLQTVVDANDAENRAQFEEIYSYIRFKDGAISLGRGDSAIELTIENDLIVFKRNGAQFGWWDGVDFHTGNIVVEVNERAQFGNFAFIPRSNGSLSFLKVGG